MLKYYKYIVLCLCFIVSNTYGQLLLENFNDSTSWKINASDGVIIQKTFLNNNKESLVKLNYSFEKGSGYGGIQKQFSIDLPDNYEISFYIKAKSVNNTLEFKLIDSAGDNVWWVNKKNFEFPSEWQKIIIKKRNISFAWGPIGGGMPKHISKIEIMITASTGGKGEVYFKDLCITEIPIADTDLSNPSLKQSPNSKLEFSGKLNRLKWEGKSNSSLLFSFNNTKDIGGLVLCWDSIYFPQQFELFTSN
ncbi:MAG: hypothetical protein Q8903_07100, partial [Bacteroidota bacterium]|nr:hypothetical protein [Bacteroidota bacterium]